LRCSWQSLLAVVLVVLPLCVAADESIVTPPLPRIAIIIDDLGDRLHDGLRATELPGAVTCAILPQTTYSRRLAEAAHGAGKEVMLHQPMEATNGQKMGPGGVDRGMDRQTMLQTLNANLDSVPYARGMNNHMGSLLTRMIEPMAWLMSALHSRKDFYFIDSATAVQSVAERIAHEQAVPSLRRNVFLDNDRSEAAIMKQFVRLVARARRVGIAIGINHPYPESLAVLEKVLPHVAEFGVRLVPVSELIKQNNRQEERLWQASLSHSQPDAKSLKQ
jgi:uncharacterized protein